MGGGGCGGEGSKNSEGDMELFRTQIVDLRKVSHCCHYRRNVTPGGRRGEQEC